MTVKGAGCWVLSAGGWVLMSDVALACPICFRVEENATTDGVQAAVLVLVGVTAVVLGVFGRFVVGFAKRDGQPTAGADDDEGQS